tara:strand:+ start:49110 stop:50642 length:1533 start_codon:yes stop_codon:yes gene_type:complete
MKAIQTTALLCVFLYLSACQSKPMKEPHVKLYQEKFRPQFHFSPEAHWMNDPNGMVYYEGEYHLFYQYYPDSTVWGPMHWGHAVSPDMVKWEHLPIALYPDSLGYIFSGSAVVDWDNTAGFGTEDNPAMVAIFTYHDAAMEKAGKEDYQYQAIAFSLDKGRSWTKYDGNPVLPNQGIRDFRDPKVSWNAAAGKWIMTLAVADHISFYSSPDLKNWAFESDFGKELGAHGGVWECPDLFQLEVEGSNEEKWVLLVSINPGGPNGGSATQYFVGSFDGKQFVPDEEIPTTRWVDQGTDNYAGVTWSDVPAEDGRRLFLGWMSNWQYAQVVPTEAWRSAMTLPRELKLKQVGSEVVLINFPAKEVGNIVGSGRSFQPENGQIIELTDALVAIDLALDGTSFDGLSISLGNDAGEVVLIDFSDSVVSIDRSKSGLVGFEKGFAATHVGKLLSGTRPASIRIFVDTASLEIFINEGELVLTELVFPTQPYDKLTVGWQGGAVVKNVTLNKVEAIW